MNILRDIPIYLTPESVLQEEFRDRRQPANPALLAAAKEAVALGQTLIAPSAIRDEFPVRDLVGNTVVLSAGSSTAWTGERQLTIGPKADLLAAAVRLTVAVYTIGPALETRVRELHRAGENLLAYMLDSVGVLALGIVGETLRRNVEEQAVELGWGVSPALSPGSLVGWPVEGQRELCTLLPLERIGVRLNDHYVLEPFKSVSMVIGLGPDYPTSHVGSMCRHCTLSDSCWRRREEQLD